MTDKIELRRSKANTTYWLFKASNGRVLATSEMYDSKRNALNAAVNLAHRINSGGGVVIVDSTGDE